MRLILIGTDTDVGKTWITTGLTLGLRQRSRDVWLHKPVACGDWDGSSAADGRALRALAGDGQDPATICPREYPEACSPHLAAQAAGKALTIEDLLGPARDLDRAAGARDLLLETAGGLLAPLTTDRRTNRDLAAALGWPCVLVTSPHLGTLNHTCLTVEAARHRGLDLRGLVVNHHHPVPLTLAVRTAAAELAALTGLPVLAEVVHGAPATAWAPAALDRLGIA
jgi:dethiobiotin synthetase